MIQYKGSSHGRVNLIGEHTDYNGGWVLPTLIPQFTTVFLTPRKDREVHASTAATHLQKSSGLTYQIGQETPTKTWIDYVHGATKILQQLGFRLGGFDLWIESNIPTGSGLSSSAALEVSLLKALRSAFGLTLEDLDIARIGQRIENEFVGARVGIMDQMACSLGQAGEALFLDTSKLTYERIPLPLSQIDFLVINSGLAHQHAGGSYNERRAECEEACRLLGVRSLRDLAFGDLYRLDALPTTLKRRARHVITENDRVHKAVKALRENDMKRLGQLFYESHLSMKEDYLVSIPEIDLLVDLCRAHPETLGARLTGGGFGGSIVALTQKGRGPAVAAQVLEAYSRQTPYKAQLLVH
ncbi:MAG: galactokinase [Bdellovibrionales bacterium]